MSNDKLKKDIVDNLKIMSKSIDDEKANDYVDSYESAFGVEGLSFLSERTREFTFAIQHGNDYGGLDYFIEILDRVNNNDEYTIEYQRKFMSDFSGFIKSVNTPEQSPVPDQQLETAQKTGYVQGVFVHAKESQELEENNFKTLPKDIWIKSEFPNFSEILKPSCFEEGFLLGIGKSSVSKRPCLIYFHKDDTNGLTAIGGNIDTLKQIGNLTVNHFNQIQQKNVTHHDFYHYIETELDIMLSKTPEQPSVSNRQLETAQKTGYVQGVCESVLAFNTDENRKIMSEATVSFLSKKMLSEMNVTKDMAQKFANPETYKALEKCVFVPAQEQQLEQTQTQGRGR